MTIFISVAAYRDPELVPTLQDCLHKASAPDQLRFGICWQHDDDESIGPFADDDRVRIIDVDYKDSRGACWARAQCMSLYRGETYFLQIDSHHRFAEGWDDILIRQHAAAGGGKAILTAYVPGYDDEEGWDPGLPKRLYADRFDEDGILLLRGNGLPDSEGPRRARFVSGHFLFAPGSFVEDIPYDPDLYFIGEEITLAVRAFTHGYGLFHPSEHVLWHRYGRAGRTLHWDDHVKAIGIDMPGVKRDLLSRRKVAAFFENPQIGRYGLGPVRTLADYEAYAGVSFRQRLASPAARAGDEPSLDRPDVDWIDKITRRTLTIRIPHAAVSPAVLADPVMWRIEMFDGEQISFEDLILRNRLSALVKDDGTHYVLPFEIADYVRADRWAVNIVSRAPGAPDWIRGSFEVETADV